MNKGNATTSYTSIGNMLKDANTINGTIYKKLLTKLGNDTTSTRKKSEINDGTSVVFKMGTVNNNSIYWQVVYQAGDIITVWMTDPYTAEYYNKSGGSINNSALLGYSTGQYSDNANYSRSILRDVTKAIYKEMATSFPVIANVVKTPSNANQTYQIGDNTYNKPTKFQYSAYHPLYYSHHNGLRDETSLDTAYYDYDWNTSNTPYTDEFWIPSWFEAFNYNNSSSGDNRWFDGGYWGLSSTDVGFSSYTSSPLNGIGAVNSNCWFRSGYSNGSHYGTLVDTSGSGVGDGVSYSRGVRPACHLSLSAMAATFPSTVTLDLQSGSGGTTSVQAIYGSAMPAITIPTRASYIFGGYYTGTNGSGTQYYTESGTSARNWDISGDTTLYAKWTAITYNLILNVNNSNFGTILNSGGSLMEGTTYTTAAVPKTNCAFLYWIDSSAPTVPIYDNPLTITVTSDKTYTAYFTDSLVEGVSVDATFGGSAEILHTTDTTSLADSDTLTLIARLRYSGYQFDGWFIQGETNAFSTDMSVSVQYGTIKNKIIIAKFSKISASINDDTENSNDFV